MSRLSNIAKLLNGERYINSNGCEHYEEVSGDMLPTAGHNDDGTGWVRERRGDQHTHIRPVLVKPSAPEVKHLYQEHSTGVWHKKGK